MKKLENFLPRLLPWCLGAPEPLLYNALVDSAIELCEETNVVKYITDPILLVDGVADYDLDIPASMDLARVLRVWIAPAPYDPPTLQLNNWLVTAVGQITIFPTPRGVQLHPMFVEVSTKPQRSATQLADILYTDYVEAVVGGAIFRVCSMPDQPYSNGGNAQMGMAAFRKGRNTAIYEETKGNVRRDTVVKPRPFA